MVGLDVIGATDVKVLLVADGRTVGRATIDAGLLASPGGEGDVPWWPYAVMVLGAAVAAGSIAFIVVPAVATLVAVRRSTAAEPGAAPVPEQLRVGLADTLPQMQAGGVR